MNEKPLILVRPFIKDIVEGKTYFCNPDSSVVVFPEESKAFIDPYGEASLEFDKDELNLICPIEKRGDKIFLLPDTTYTYTPYHNSQKKIMDAIDGWIEVQIICDLHEGKDESINLPYSAMGLGSLENYLANWLTIAEDNDKNPSEIHEIQEIRNAFLEKVETEKNKESLLHAWNNLEVSLTEFDDDEFQNLLRELQHAASKRLIQLGSKKKARVLKDLNLQELEELLSEATQQEIYEGPNGAIAIKKEIEARQKKK